MAHLRLAAALVLAACANDPAPTLIDAGPVDADPNGRCLIPASYGGLGAEIGAADVTGANSITITLAAGPPKDDLFLAFTAGKGAFANGIKPGTYPITGDDTSFNTCGLCTTVLAHIDAQTGPAKFFFADSGTVTLTTATPTAPSTPSQFIGSAENLHFVEITIGTGGAAPIQGGCTTAIDAVSFAD
jgi:hypothetical protein